MGFSEQASVTETKHRNSSQHQADPEEGRVFSIAKSFLVQRNVWTTYLNDRACQRLMHTLL